MSRYIAPIILILVSIATFFLLTNPVYQEIYSDTYNKETGLNAQLKSYNDALDNATALKSERDALVEKEGSILPDDMLRLEKLLPQGVDNIRLVLEIEKIAELHNMALKDIKYDTTADKNSTGSTSGEPVVQGGGATESTPKDYGIFNLEFSTTGTYVNFIDFTKELEKNLRIVDISSISFSSDSVAATGAATGISTNINSSDIYKYDFKINTYWLKN